MKKHHILVALFLAILFTSCEKNGETIIKPIKKIMPFNIKGFVIGDTLEQYFDGRKIREFTAWSKYDGKIVFDSDAPILMEIKRKGDSKALLSQTITQDRANPDQYITFYYADKVMKEKYTYPAPIANLEQIAFYFASSVDMPVDIVYADASGDINAVTYLARNVQSNKWIDFLQIPPLNSNGQDLYIFLLKAGKKEWLVDNNFELSYIQANLPIDGGWYQGGGVQAIYIQISKDGKPGLSSVNDLVTTFR